MATRQDRILLVAFALQLSLFVTQIRDQHSFHQMPPQNGDLLFRSVALPLFLHGTPLDSVLVLTIIDPQK